MDIPDKAIARALLSCSKVSYGIVIYNDHISYNRRHTYVKSSQRHVGLKPSHMSAHTKRKINTKIENHNRESNP